MTLYRFIFFHEYCKKCKHERMQKMKALFECLNEPENLHSHKPVNWEAKREMTLEEAIQEFEDFCYHHSLHPEISNEALVMR